MPTGTTWPTAAWGDGKGRRHAVEVSEAPSDARLGLLSQGTFDWKPISARALKGFVTRARDSRLFYPDGFLEALEVSLRAL